MKETIIMKNKSAVKRQIFQQSVETVRSDDYLNWLTNEPDYKDSERLSRPVGPVELAEWLRRKDNLAARRDIKHMRREIEKQQ
jgi:hypothetical protein